MGDPSREFIAEAFGLSPGEALMVSQIIAGLSVKEAGKESGISNHTVKSRVRTVYLKMNVSSQAELVSTTWRAWTKELLCRS